MMPLSVEVKKEPEWEDYCISEAEARAATRAVKRESSPQPAAYSSMDNTKSTLKKCDSKANIEESFAKSNEFPCWLKQWAGLYSSSEDADRIQHPKDQAPVANKTKSMSQEPNTLPVSQNIKTTSVITSDVKKNSKLTDKIEPRIITLKRVTLKKPILHPVVITKDISKLPVSSKDKSQAVTTNQHTLQRHKDVQTRAITKAVIKPQSVSKPFSPRLMAATTNSQSLPETNFETIKNPVVSEPKTPPVEMTLMTHRPAFSKPAAQPPFQPLSAARSNLKPLFNTSNPHAHNLELFNDKKLSHAADTQKTQQPTLHNVPSADISRVAQSPVPINTTGPHLVTENEILRNALKGIRQKVSCHSKNSLEAKRMKKRCLLDVAISQTADGGVTPVSIHSLQQNGTKLVISTAAKSELVKLQRIVPQLIHPQIIDILAKSSEISVNAKPTGTDHLQPKPSTILIIPIPAEQPKQFTVNIIPKPTEGHQQPKPFTVNVISKLTEDNERPKPFTVKIIPKFTQAHQPKPFTVNIIPKPVEDKRQPKQSTVNIDDRRPTEADNKQPKPSTVIPKSVGQQTPVVTKQTSVLKRIPHRKDFLMPCFVKLERINKLPCKNSLYEKELLIDDRACFPMNTANKHLNEGVGLYNGDRFQSSYLPCKFCRKTFKLRVALNNHVRQIHLARKLYTCDICGKKYTKRVTIIKHLKSHTVKPFPCKLSKTHYRTPDRLATPKRIHAIEKRKYSALDSPCRERRGMLEHNTQVESRPHVCYFCNKRFIRKYDMHRHMTIHMREKHTEGGSYLCVVCKKVFRSQAFLNRHTKVHERPMLLSCDICNRKCKNRTGLTNHKHTHKNDMK